MVISSSASSIFFFFSFFGRGAPLATDPTDSRRIVDVRRPHADDVRRPPKIDIERPGCESFVDVRRDAATLPPVLRAPSETADDWADGSGGVVDECFFPNGFLSCDSRRWPRLLLCFAGFGVAASAPLCGCSSTTGCSPPPAEPFRARSAATASASAGWVSVEFSTVTPHPELKRPETESDERHDDAVVRPCGWVVDSASVEYGLDEDAALSAPAAGSEPSLRR